MIHDPIIDEIRNYREKHAEQFNFDIDTIVKDHRRIQNTLKRRVFSNIDGELKQVNRKEKETNIQDFVQTQSRNLQ